MPYLPPTFRPVLALLPLLFGLPLPAQLSQSLPNGFLTTSGGSGSAYPFNTAGASHKWQWVYDSGQFALQASQTITQISVRALNQGAIPNAFSFPSLRVTLASSPNHYALGTPPAGQDAVFANNLGADQTVVRAAAPFTGGPVAAGSWVSLGLTAPFTYNPALGQDLVVQLEVCGATTTWGTTIDGRIGSAGTVFGNRYGNIAAGGCTATTRSFNNNEYVPIVKIDYAPAGLSANFSATPLSGPAALAVSFTDTSTTTDPGGITSWDWDFQNDGITDSTLPNPSFTYTVPGTWSVRLTVTDASHPASSLLRTGYVSVGPYQLVVLTTGGGVGDISIIPPPPPPGAGEGFLFFSHTPPPVAGTGPFFGVNFDDFVMFSLVQPAAPGWLFHFTLPAGGLFPAAPFVAGPGSIASLAGVTLDFVIVTAAGGTVEATNVARITI